MENKKIVIMGMIILIIVGVILLMFTNSVKYERIEITPNGTSLEVPANQTKYNGDFDGIKVWNWDNGALVTYNSHNNIENNSLTGLGFSVINDLIKNKEKQDIDGFPGYMINTDEIVELQINDFINLKGKIFCIPLSNETSKDNIFIFCNDKDMAVHIAKSVQYKNVYPDNATLNTTGTANNITTNLESNLSNVTLNDIKTIIG